MMLKKDPIRTCLSSNRILVVQVAGIGDMVMGVPALRSLRFRFPEAYIGLVTTPRALGIIDGCPYVDRVLSFDVKRFRRFRDLLSIERALEMRAFFKSMARQRFDIAINLYLIGGRLGALRMLAFLRLTRAACTVGRYAKQYGQFFDLCVSERGHEVERQLQVVGALGANTVDTHLELWVSPQDRAFCDRVLAEQGVAQDGLLICISPGSNRPAARWLPERFAAVADRLAEGHGATVVITGASEEIPIAEDIASRMHTKGIVLAGRTNLRQLAALFDRCHLVIANDSGPMHMAAAMGTPLVAIFGPANPEHTGPMGPQDRHIVVRSGVGCHPCDRVACSRLDCQKAITVDRVRQAADTLLTRLNPSVYEGKDRVHGRAR